MSLSIHKLDGVHGEDAVCVLSKGEHPIGRGPLLQCTDKRASSHQALIKVKAESSSITSTHRIPCFYQSCESRTVTILSENNPVDIRTGDKFGFFPDKYWFKLSFEPEKVGSTMSQGEGCLKRSAEEIDLDVVEKKKAKLAGDCHNEVTRQESIGDTCEPVVVDGAEKQKNSDVEGVQSQVESHVDDEESNTVNSAVNGESANGYHNEDEGVACATLDNQLIVREEERPDLGGENDKEGAPEADKPKPDGNPSTSTKREKCWYGAGCYRKSSGHRSQFSHPDDVDYDSDSKDDRPTCSYGANCYRLNKDHRKEYKHPGRPANRKRYEEASAEDDYYDYEDPFQDDGSEDEYVEENWSGGDSDDDYEDFLEESSVHEYEEDSSSEGYIDDDGSVHEYYEEDDDWGEESQQLSEDKDTTTNLLKEAQKKK